MKHLFFIFVCLYPILTLAQDGFPIKIQGFSEKYNAI